MLDRHQLTSDLLTDYALGFLSPAEASEVEAALDVHPEAREEVNGYLSGLTDLVMDLEPVAVPQGAADRLMARLEAEQSPTAQVATSQAAQHTAQNLAFTPVAPLAGQAVSEPSASERAAPVRRSWLYPLIAVAAAVAVGVAVLPGLNRPSGDFASRQGQQGAVSTTLNDKAGVPLADVVRLPDGQAYVQMRSAVPAGRAYQAWKIEGGKPVSLGMFRGREYGSQLPAGTVFAVTVEPQGGSEQATTTPLFAQPI